MKRAKNCGWIALGCVCLSLGTVGLALPMLPTVPLYIATLFCFARSSNRLHRWFQKTSLHRKHLEPFLRTKALTLKSKIAVMASLTLLMEIGCFMMQGLLAAQLVLAAVWAFHVWYFTVRIKTLAANR